MKGFDWGAGLRPKSCSSRVRFGARCARRVARCRLPLRAKLACSSCPAAAPVWRRRLAMVRACVRAVRRNTAGAGRHSTLTRRAPRAARRATAGGAPRGTRARAAERPLRERLRRQRRGQRRERRRSAAQAPRARAAVGHGWRPPRQRRGARGGVRGAVRCATQRAWRGVRAGARTGPLASHNRVSGTCQGLPPPLTRMPRTGSARAAQGASLTSKSSTCGAIIRLTRATKSAGCA
jgi:hypothetical protein